MAISPVSTGGRSPSSVARSNSGAESRNRQPRWAREAAPGCGHRREQAKAQIAAAAREGLTPESLAVAETLLKAVPSRLDELARDQAQLGTDERELSGQAQQLQRSEQQLSTLQATATSRANAHTAATTTHDEYREAVDHLSACTEQALLTAATAGEAIEQEHDAVRELGVRRAAIGPLDAAVAAAAAVRQSAEDQLAAVRSHESAHAAGAALAAGDRCLICQRTLPDDYHPPAPADPQALADAERAARKAAQAEQAAGKAHAEGQAHLDAAHRASKERQEAARQALLGFDKACTEALAAMRDAAPREPSAAAGPSVSYQMFEAALAADCSRLSAADCGERDALRDTSARNLLEPARAMGKALAEAAAQAGQAARKAELEAARASERLASDNTAHQQASDRLVARRKRLDDSRGQLRSEIGELPALAREALPAEPLNAAPGHLTAAHAAVSGRRQHLAAMGKDRDEATGQLEELAEKQRELDGRRSREIAAPLQKLAADIGLWRDAIGQAAAATPGSTPAALPADPASIGTNDLEAHVEALAAAGAAISGRVTGAAAASDREAGDHLMKLAETASGLRAGQHGFPGIPLTDGKQLLEAGALDPVVAAEQSASDAAERHLAVHADAESQIDKAERLDTAISAGHQKLTAVDALRSLLADAKFLQYLTDRRTHALLGVASELFGQLSDGEFGFAEDFLIISRRSRATRHPKTLSGGETFLASLALALALVELHSRSGARLGALFLDEGFGSLDVDALASSLDVLRNETSGDKLVAVISHLHAVAEAVEDVMWVERRPEGSSARWLSAAERDALVRQEVTGGLLSLL
jgi:DNA repair protein SbcC/Rad50